MTIIPISIQNHRKDNQISMGGQTITKRTHQEGWGCGIFSKAVKTVE